jgi:hypothetical protein
MVNKENFWDDNYYNHPNLTDEMVQYAENELEVKLPSFYIELLKVMNGGYTNGFLFPVKTKISWSGNYIPLPDLRGIVTDSNIATSLNILDTPYMTKEWGLPEKQVLLSGDGHCWVTLDYRRGESPSVRWIDVDAHEDVHVADSFEEFFEGLIADETHIDEM